MTPLSDCITALALDQSPPTWKRFFDTLVDARVGVIGHTADGSPLPVGEFVTTANLSVKLGKTTRHGMRMLLACADPTIYRERYRNQPFTAEVDATTLFDAVIANASCEGILVNSAAGEHSVPVTRAQVIELLKR